MHRQKLQAAVRPAQCIALDHDLLAPRRVNRDGRNRIGDGLHPGVADLLDRAPHADGIDFRRGRQRADRHRRVIAPASPVRHMREQKRPPLRLGQAALELPAHQRVQLGVLVDRPVDAPEQAGRLEPCQMLLKVERRSARSGVGLLAAALVEH